ncbi:hypothetical protein Terro_3666 [Terriglobus roseus DSM 18391]|uniref:Uncharacterized protein n=1 Tax=Terriglobus roseus (strain DSM 18391 / NRRL B-41598 / KBS 63) TaxID=926566 RepID=I3ZKW1_TERRK|nr:hypothetical protein [Terriglobus roseus]AFL89879.1 hypothetical protein Terro_3666 [Terriglobus roseus DSM 18391]
MLRPRHVLLAYLATAVFFVPNAISQTTIRMYVQAGSGDFAANGAGDSALDLRKALLGKSRTIRVVDSPSEAEVVVRIDSRNVRKETAAVNTYANQSKDGRSGTATTVPTVRNVDELHVTLLAGNSQIPLQTESALSWRLAAGDMASSIDHWVKENYAKLIVRRTEQRYAPSAPTAPAAPSTPSGNSGSGDASIAPGMSESQVLEAMGAPEKKVIFGKKSLWNYRGMQIVFEDGRVTDVKF